MKPELQALWQLLKKMSHYNIGGLLEDCIVLSKDEKSCCLGAVGEACHAAVDSQIDYGKQRGIAWGISESAFSAPGNKLERKG